MSRSLLSASAYLFALALLPSLASAASLVIDFDTAPGGIPIPEGTVLDSVYADLGVTFGHVPTVDHFRPASGCGDGPDVYASSECLVRGPISPPNVVTPCSPAFCSDINSLFGIMYAHFANPASKVCIDWLGVHDNCRAVLDAYDENGNPVGSIVSPDGKLQSLCLEIEGIRTVKFFANSGDDYGWFDNLEVTFAAVPAIPATIGRVKAHYR